jgi:V8-like Glu-specific endopeptidase
MKKRFFLLVMLLSGLAASAQVSTHYFESKNAFRSFPALKQAEAKEMSLKKMPQFDARKLLEEDREVEGLDVPFRFGHDFEVDYTLSSGKWANQGGKRIWNMRVSSPGAYSLNFIFSELNLIPGAELYIYNPEGSMVYGPVTAEQNISEGTFLTDLIAGDEVIIQLIEPDVSKRSSSLRIIRVVHAYKNMFPFQTGTGLRVIGDAGACNNDVACYPDWTLESGAVAHVLLSNGTSQCTGSLLNNTAHNYKPYFLTAFHCIDTSKVKGSLSNVEKTAAENWMFRFNYKKPTCSGGTATTVSYNQAYFRAAHNDTDFALMELKTSITHSNAVFLGWDRASTASTSGTGIHHPRGDLMKISFDNDNLTETSYLNNAGTSHWRVDWNNGVTETGSSGSPLFNTNKRVIGQLHGGYSLCSTSDKRDWYGCLYRSWTGGGTDDTRLSNWLNPNGSSATTTNSLFRIIGPTNVPCSGTVTYSAPATSWTVSSNLQIMSGQGTNTITVKARPISSTTISGWITAGTVSKSVSVALPPFVTVTGPSSTTTNGTAYFHASPIFPASEGDYEWVVEPSSGASMSPSRNSNAVTFSAPGSYSIGCRSYNACATGGSFSWTGISVGSYYMVSHPASSKILTVSLAGSANQDMLQAKRMVDYTLTNVTTGAVVASGKMPASGGTLDFSNVPTSIYVLRIDAGNGTPETFKVILK